MKTATGRVVQTIWGRGVIIAEENAIFHLDPHDWARVGEVVTVEYHPEDQFCRLVR